MRLASLPCQVQPRVSLTINAPISGQLRVYTDRPQTNLPAGFLWAEFEPKSLQMESSEHAEAKEKIDELERHITEIDLPKQKIKLNKESSEATKQVMVMSKLATNPELAHVAINAAGLTKDGVLKAGSLQQARDEDSQLMQRNLEYLSATNSVAAGVDLRERCRMECGTASTGV